jgi:hypothetical protein
VRNTEKTPNVSLILFIDAGFTPCSVVNYYQNIRLSQTTPTRGIDRLREFTYQR